MSKPKLSKQEKAQCKVIFTVVIVGLLLTEADKQTGKSDPLKDNPAAQQCAALVDELLQAKDEQTRKHMLEVIQKARLRFTKKVKNLGTAEGTLAAIEVICSDLFKSSPGTRFDFIRCTFENNLPAMQKQQGLVQAHVSTFRKEFREAILSI